MALLLTYLAGVYACQNSYADAEETSQQALSVRKMLFGLHHPDVARSLVQLARLSRQRRDYTHAESLYQQALTILRQAYGFEQALASGGGTVEPGYELLGYILVQYASLLGKMSRWEELDVVLERLRAIQPGWRERMA